MQTITCDECGKEIRGRCVEVHNLEDRGGGILMPRYEFEFCDRQCLLNWLDWTEDGKKGSYG
jgi:hypothetical protein